MSSLRTLSYGTCLEEFRRKERATVGPLRRLTCVLTSISVAAILFLLGTDSQARESTLILPFELIGVDQTTGNVSRSLLSNEFEQLGYSVLSVPAFDLPECARQDCAQELGRLHGAERVVYGTLSRLGSKVIVRVSSFTTASDSLDYQDRLNAATIENLDVVMTRVAEGVASGRGKSSHLTVGTVLEDEAKAPLLRQGRRGFGVRAGFLFPAGDSYGIATRLTTIRFPYKFERERFFVETTTLLGMAWDSNTVDWTILDVFAARYFDVENSSIFLGGGVGLHVVHVEGPPRTFETPDPGPIVVTGDQSQTSTAPTIDIGTGVTFLRTYDFQLHLDLRYHIVLEDFENAGGDGAHGLIVTIGTGK